MVSLIRSFKIRKKLLIKCIFYIEIKVDCFVNSSKTIFFGLQGNLNRTRTAMVLYYTIITANNYWYFCMLIRVRPRTCSDWPKSRNSPTAHISTSNHSLAHCNLNCVCLLDVNWSLISGSVSLYQSTGPGLILNN